MDKNINNPLVTVITPTYNGSKYIEEAIISVLSQTYTNFEYIIIDDASTQNSFGIINKYINKDKRIKFIKNKRNLEKSATKNIGAKIAKGKYLAFIDDDDIWGDKDKLKKQVNFLEKNSSYGIIGTNAKTINDDGNKIGNIKVSQDDNNIRNLMLLYNQFLQSSVLINKDMFNKVGGFNEKINMCEDYDLWLRLGIITKLKNLEDESLIYRVRKNSTTGKNKFKMKVCSFKYVIKNRNNYPGFYLGVLVRISTFIIPMNILIFFKKIYDKAYKLS